MADSAPLYPLRFRPVLKRHLWGGRKLGEQYHKPVGLERLCAESWEVADLQGSQTIVDNGPWTGLSLARLVAEHEAEIFGRNQAARRAALAAHPEIEALARFPLLIKLLDAAQHLSVQVHPDAARGALLDPPELGKTEAWYVLEAEPGARIFAGLRPGVDRAALERALAVGEAAKCLDSFEPQPGDCLLLPSGMVHALGAGVVVFEVQTPCDVTYRLFDWNRLGPDGRARTLHVHEGLEAIDFGLPPPTPRRLAAQPVAPGGSERLVACKAFVIDRWSIDGAATLLTEDTFRVLHVVSGELSLESHPSVQLAQGDTCLLPAGLAAIGVRGQGVALDVHLPV